MKPYKVEAKGSLYEVTLEEGCYSDWRIHHYIFSGNSEEEVWEFLKIFAKNGGIDDISHFRSHSNTFVSNVLRWNDRYFIYHEIETDDGDYFSKDDDFLVKIKRAHVVYVLPERLEPDYTGTEFVTKPDCEAITGKAGTAFRFNPSPTDE